MTKELKRVKEGPQGRVRDLEYLAAALHVGHAQVQLAVEAPEAPKGAIHLNHTKESQRVRV